MDVVIADGDAETDVPDASPGQLQQCPQAVVETVEDAAQCVVDLRQPLDADPQADVRVLLEQPDDFVRAISVGTDDYAAALGLQYPDDFLKVRSQEWLAAGDVQGRHVWKLLVVFRPDFFAGSRRELPGVAHAAPGVTAIGDDNAGKANSILQTRPLRSDTRPAREHYAAWRLKNQNE